MAEVVKARLANGENVSFKYTVDGGEAVDLSGILRSIPDIAENREQVETTVLSSLTKTYINGLKDYGELEFGFLYDGKVAADVRALGDAIAQVEVGLSDGSKVKFPAQLSSSISAASSGALMEMTIKCALAGDINIDIAGIDA